MEIYEGFDYYHLSYPKVTVIVTCGTFEKPNALAVSWHTYLSFEPPLYGISIAPRRYSHNLIEKYGEFGVNFLPFEKSELVWKVGSVSGRNVNKFEKFNIKTFKGKVIRAPLITDSISAFECVVIDKFRVGDHTFFVGEIKVAWYRKDLFESGLLKPEKVSQAYYLGEGVFIALDPKKIIKLL